MQRTLNTQRTLKHATHPKYAHTKYATHQIRNAPNTHAFDIIVEFPFAIMYNTFRE